MSLEDARAANETTRSAWNANAAYWDARMRDEGNDFVNELVWPAAQRLLDPRPDERLLDIGCGNGLYARRLAALKMNVVAIDFASEMIELARSYASEPEIEYHVLDATDERALLSLGKGTFDAAFSTMALMDMAEIEPVFRALARLLRPNGRFVFAVAHPCFNHAQATRVAEMDDQGGTLATTYAVKVRGYMTSITAAGVAIEGQPEAQLYFDRPLHELFAPGFAAGFVIDALEERAFSPENEPTRNPLGWSGKFSELPPVMIVRMRLPAS